MLEAQVASAPEARCLVGPDSSLTYGEFSAASDRWALVLRGRGLVRDEISCIQLPPSAAAVCAAFGVLKAGGGFLFIDPSQPLRRREQIFSDSGSRVLIAEDRLAAGLAAECVITPSSLDAAADAPLRAPEPSGDSIAYVVYTSGSTGQPKGVLCEHAALANVARGQRQIFGVRPDDRVALLAPLTVDAAVFEMILALCAGASLHIPTAADRYLGPPLQRYLDDNAVTTVVATPYTLRSVAASQLPCVRLVISAGEKLPSSLAAEWAGRRTVVNAYGVTEATIWSTYMFVGALNGDASVPIGKPIPGCTVEVVDALLNPVGPGEAGELLIGGVGVARGYLHHEELNAASFVERTSGRMYRTGDQVVQRADGNLVFVDRKDGQVKIGGLRIELDEIREHLLRHPGVQDCVVSVRHERLAAYVVPRPQGLGATPTELLEWLEDRLPLHMVPFSYTVLPGLPLTGWGKVDVHALPEPVLITATPPAAPPASATQQNLTEAIQSLLGIDEAQPDDDLFLLGLDSLGLARMMVLVSERFEVDVEPIDVFDHPTIATLSSLIDARAGSGS
ncbi:amino acid adenylation domain-containing protein [Streptomyces sp. NPDC002659]|uniref:amino acid adenylation domain-containing protein n=1 Tax=Streptomyces sp. NPDC002659 TaxID=3364656 RepID=UPI0036A7D817